MSAAISNQLCLGARFSATDADLALDNGDVCVVDAAPGRASAAAITGTVWKQMFRSASNDLTVASQRDSDLNGH